MLIIDKPLGQSSNRSLQLAKRIFNAQKAGHTGSLDPLATGVLPLCFGEATKFSQYLLDADKQYRCTVVLGIATASGDAEGEVIERCDASAVTEAQVVAALDKFKGEIEQRPSIYSALKQDGKPLYKLARKGIEVERKVRQVTIHRIALEQFRSAAETGAEPEADIFVHCSKGTYIRSIAEDLGTALGCGGYVKMLRRTQVGKFGEQQLVTMDCLQTLADVDDEISRQQQLDDLLLPADAVLEEYPQVVLAESATPFMLQGHAVMVSQAPHSGMVRIYSHDQQFLGLGEVLDDGRIGPKRLIATN